MESTQDEMTLRFLEKHLVMVPMEPRRPGCSVVEGKDITPNKVAALAKAADDCWNAIINHDLNAFAQALAYHYLQVLPYLGTLPPVLQIEDLGTKGEKEKGEVDDAS